MSDPLEKLLLPDAEFARLTQEQKFAYIQKVLRALLAERAAEQPGSEPDQESEN